MSSDMWQVSMDNAGVIGFTGLAGRTEAWTNLQADK